MANQFRGDGDITGMATGVVRQNDGSYLFQDQKGNQLGSSMSYDQLKSYLDPSNSGGLRTDMESFGSVKNGLYRAPAQGTINNALAQSGAAVASAAPSAGAPSTVASPAPNADNVDLVESRVNNIARSDSPLMQQARGAALQQMNDRGLINSSLGIGAAQDAVIRNALPIAQQDAGAVNFVRNREDEQAFTTGRDATQQGYTQANMQLGNQLQSGLNQQQQGYTQSNMRLGNDLQQSNMELQSRLQTSMDNANRAWQSNESVLNRDLQLKMQQTQNALTQEAQKTQVGMTLASTYYNTVSTILMDPNLDAAAKQAQIDKALSNYQSMLQIVQKSTGIDLSQVGPIFQTDGKKTTQPVTTGDAQQQSAPGSFVQAGRDAFGGAA